MKIVKLYIKTDIFELDWIFLLETATALILKYKTDYPNNFHYHITHLKTKEVPFSIQKSLLFPREKQKKTITKSNQNSLF